MENGIEVVGEEQESLGFVDFRHVQKLELGTSTLF